MTVRFGLIGCGKVVERLAAPELQHRSEGIRIGALVDCDAAAARNVAERFNLGPENVWSDWRRMLKEADIDAVAVCVPNDLHAEVAVASLEAGKHVLVEKPLARTLKEGKQIVDAARRRNRLLMVEQTQRFSPVHEVVQEVLGGGLLGPIHQLRGRIGHAGPEYWCGHESSWFTNGRRSGGGALIDIGVHIIDLLRWLSGKEVRRVFCHTATLEKRIAVEDNAGALLEFQDGTIGSFEVSWNSRPWDVTTEFYGKRGTIRSSLTRSRPVEIVLSKSTDQSGHLGEPFCPTIPSESRWGGPYHYFAHCIEKQCVPFVSGEEGLASLAVVLSAYESAKSGDWVDVPDVRAGRSRNGVARARSRR